MPRKLIGSPMTLFFLLLRMAALQWQGQRADEVGGERHEQPKQPPHRAQAAFGGEFCQGRCFLVAADPEVGSAEARLQTASCHCHYRAAVRRNVDLLDVPALIHHRCFSREEELRREVDYTSSITYNSNRRIVYAWNVKEFGRNA